MFDSLQDGLKGAFKSLRGKGKLTEGNMRDGLKMVEQSMLDADVSIDVVRSFMGRVSEQALGEKVLLALAPEEQLVGIVNEELIELLGPVDSETRIQQGRQHHHVVRPARFGKNNHLRKAGQTSPTPEYYADVGCR